MRHATHLDPGDLAAPVPEPQVAERPAGGQGMNTVRQDAEGSLHFLLHTATKPAVLLVRAWHVKGIPFAFEHMPLYQELANQVGCFIVSVTRPEAGGEEHLLFAAKVAGLTAHQCLASIDNEPQQP